MIRRAEKKDIPDVLKLLVQVCMVHHNGRPDLFKGPATKYNAAELEEMFEDDTRPVFVLTDENDEHVLGYCFCVFEEHGENHVLTNIKTLYIDDLCVDEAQRGKHVGTDLYRYVVDFAKANEVYNITLNVWACNPSAQAFYEHLGLKPQKIGMEMIL